MSLEFGVKTIFFLLGVERTFGEEELEAAVVLAEVMAG